MEQRQQLRKMADNSDLDSKQLNSLRVIDLRSALERRGLPKGGSKKELVERLKLQLKLEKLQKEADKTEDKVPNLALQDELAGQNDFVRQYLAAQQQTYATQLRERRLAELEASFSSSPQEEVPLCEQKEEPPAPSPAPTPAPVQTVAEPKRERARRESWERKRGRQCPSSIDPGGESSSLESPTRGEPPLEADPPTEARCTRPFSTCNNPKAEATCKLRHTRRLPEGAPPQLEPRHRHQVKIEPPSKHARGQYEETNELKPEHQQEAKLGVPRKLRCARGQHEEEQGSVQVSQQEGKVKVLCKVRHAQGQHDEGKQFLPELQQEAKVQAPRKLRHARGQAKEVQEFVPELQLEAKAEAVHKLRHAREQPKVVQELIPGCQLESLAEAPRKLRHAREQQEKIHKVVPDCQQDIKVQVPHKFHHSKGQHEKAHELMPACQQDTKVEGKRKMHCPRQKAKESHHTKPEPKPQQMEAKVLLRRLRHSREWHKEMSEQAAEQHQEAAALTSHQLHSSCKAQQAQHKPKAEVSPAVHPAVMQPQVMQESEQYHHHKTKADVSSRQRRACRKPVGEVASKVEQELCQDFEAKVKVPQDPEMSQTVDKIVSQKECQAEWALPRVRVHKIRLEDSLGKYSTVGMKSREKQELHQTQQQKPPQTETRKLKTTLRRTRTPSSEGPPLKLFSGISDTKPLGIHEGLSIEAKDEGAVQKLSPSMPHKSVWEFQHTPKEEQHRAQQQILPEQAHKLQEETNPIQKVVSKDSPKELPRETEPGSFQMERLLSAEAKRISTEEVPKLEERKPKTKLCRQRKPSFKEPSFPKKLPSDTEINCPRTRRRLSVEVKDKASAAEEALKMRELKRSLRHKRKSSSEGDVQTKSLGSAEPDYPKTQGWSSIEDDGGNGVVEVPKRLRLRIPRETKESADEADQQGRIRSPRKAAVAPVVPLHPAEVQEGPHHSSRKRRQSLPSGGTVDACSTPETVLMTIGSEPYSSNRGRKAHRSSNDVPQSTEELPDKALSAEEASHKTSADTKLLKLQSAQKTRFPLPDPTSSRANSKTMIAEVSTPVSDIQATATPLERPLRDTSFFAPSEHPSTVASGTSTALVPISNSCLQAVIDSVNESQPLEVPIAASSGISICDSVLSSNTPVSVPSVCETLPEVPSNKKSVHTEITSVFGNSQSALQEQRETRDQITSEEVCDKTSIVITSQILKEDSSVHRLEDSLQELTRRQDDTQESLRSKECEPDTEASKVTAFNDDKIHSAAVTMEKALETKQCAGATPKDVVLIQAVRNESSSVNPQLPKELDLAYKSDAIESSHNILPPKASVRGPLTAEEMTSAVQSILTETDHISTVAEHCHDLPDSHTNIVDVHEVACATDALLKEMLTEPEDESPLHGDEHHNVLEAMQPQESADPQALLPFVEDADETKHEAAVPAPEPQNSQTGIPAMGTKPLDERQSMDSLNECSQSILKVQHESVDTQECGVRIDDEDLTKEPAQADKELSLPKESSTESSSSQANTDFAREKPNTQPGGETEIWEQEIMSHSDKTGIEINRKEELCSKTNPPEVCTVQLSRREIYSTEKGADISLEEQYKQAASYASEHHLGRPSESIQAACLSEAAKNNCHSSHAQTVAPWQGQAPDMIKGDPKTEQELATKVENQEQKGTVGPSNSTGDLLDKVELANVQLEPQSSAGPLTADSTILNEGEGMQSLKEELGSGILLETQKEEAQRHGEELLEKTVESKGMARELQKFGNKRSLSEVIMSPSRGAEPLPLIGKHTKAFQEDASSRETQKKNVPGKDTKEGKHFAQQQLSNTTLMPADAELRKGQEMHSIEKDPSIISKEVKSKATSSTEKQMGNHQAVNRLREPSNEIRPVEVSVPLFCEEQSHNPIQKDAKTFPREQSPMVEISKHNNSAMVHLERTEDDLVYANKAQNPMQEELGKTSPLPGDAEILRQGQAANLAEESLDFSSKVASVEVPSSGEMILENLLKDQEGARLLQDSREKDCPSEVDVVLASSEPPPHLVKKSPRDQPPAAEIKRLEEKGESAKGNAEGLVHEELQGPCNKTDTLPPGNVDLPSTMESQNISLEVQNKETSSNEDTVRKEDMGSSGKEFGTKVDLFLINTPRFCKEQATSLIGGSNASKEKVQEVKEVLGHGKEQDKYLYSVTANSVPAKIYDADAADSSLHEMVSTAPERTVLEKATFPMAEEPRQYEGYVPVPATTERDMVESSVRLSMFSTTDVFAMQTLPLSPVCESSCTDGSLHLADIATANTEKAEIISLKSSHEKETANFKPTGDLSGTEANVKELEEEIDKQCTDISLPHNLEHHSAELSGIAKVTKNIAKMSPGSDKHTFVPNKIQEEPVCDIDIMELGTLCPPEQAILTVESPPLASAQKDPKNKDPLGSLGETATESGYLETTFPSVEVLGVQATAPAQPNTDEAPAIKETQDQLLHSTSDIVQYTTSSFQARSTPTSDTVVYPSIVGVPDEPEMLQEATVEEQDPYQLPKSANIVLHSYSSFKAESVSTDNTPVEATTVGQPYTTKASVVTIATTGATDHPVDITENTFLDSNKLFQAKAMLSNVTLPEALTVSQIVTGKVSEEASVRQKTHESPDLTSTASSFDDYRIPRAEPTLASNRLKEAPSAGKLDVATSAHTASTEEAKSSSLAAAVSLLYVHNSAKPDPTTLSHPSTDVYSVTQVDVANTTLHAAAMESDRHQPPCPALADTTSHVPGPSEVETRIVGTASPETPSVFPDGHSETEPFPTDGIVAETQAPTPGSMLENTMQGVHKRYQEDSTLLKVATTCEARAVATIGGPPGSHGSKSKETSQMEEVQEQCLKSPVTDLSQHGYETFQQSISQVISADTAACVTADDAAIKRLQHLLQDSAMHEIIHTESSSAVARVGGDKEPFFEGSKEVEAVVRKIKVPQGLPVTNQRDTSSGEGGIGPSCDQSQSSSEPWLSLDTTPTKTPHMEARNPPEDFQQILDSELCNTGSHLSCSDSASNVGSASSNQPPTEETRNTEIPFSEPRYPVSERHLSAAASQAKAEHQQKCSSTSATENISLSCTGTSWSEGAASSRGALQSTKRGPLIGTPESPNEDKRLLHYGENNQSASCSTVEPLPEWSRSMTESSRVDSDEGLQKHSISQLACSEHCTAETSPNLGTTVKSPIRSSKADSNSEDKMPSETSALRIVVQETLVAAENVQCSPATSLEKGTVGCTRDEEAVLPHSPQLKECASLSPKNWETAGDCPSTTTEQIAMSEHPAMALEQQCGAVPCLKRRSTSSQGNQWSASSGNTSCGSKNCEDIPRGTESGSTPKLSVEGSKETATLPVSKTRVSAKGNKCRKTHQDSVVVTERKLQSKVVQSSPASATRRQNPVNRIEPCSSVSPMNVSCFCMHAAQAYLHEPQ